MEFDLYFSGRYSSQEDIETAVHWCSIKGLQSATALKKTLQHGGIFYEFRKFFRSALLCKALQATASEDVNQFEASTSVSKLAI